MRGYRSIPQRAMCLEDPDPSKKLKPHRFRRIFHAAGVLKVNTPSNMKPPARPPRSSSGPLVYILAWTLALTRPVARAAASPILVGDARNTANDTVTVFEDLPEGFHNDIDSITVAVGGHHTCALEYRPGVDFGGPVRCWGSNNWGQSSPSDEIFVQVRGQLGHRPSRG